jgi:hypothetical protein
MKTDGNDNALNVCRHMGTWGDGNYVATIEDNGAVILTTIYDNANQKATVNLSRTGWDRLVAWVEWQRKNNIESKNHRA